MRVLVGRATGGAFPQGSTLWRLLAANNCTLGRSAAAFPDASSCTAAVLALGRRLPDAVLRLGPDGPGWRWALELDGQVVAVAARRASSRRDAQAAGATFVRSLPQALAVVPLQRSAGASLLDA